LDDDAMAVEANDQLVPLAQLPPEEVHAVQGALEVRDRRAKDYIIAF
jgi:hypothetical protein